MNFRPHFLLTWAQRGSGGLGVVIDGGQMLLPDEETRRAYVKIYFLIANARVSFGVSVEF